MRDSEVEVIGIGDRGRAVATLTLAFANDALMRWLWPDESVYLSFFPKFVDAIAGAAFVEASADWFSQGSAAALWLAPGAKADDDRLVEIMLESVEPDLLADLAAFADVVHDFHPSEDHWYLPFIGVDPPHQGKGLGATLLQHAMVRCDHDELPAYLEASSPRNRALYERFGFKELGVIQVGSSPMVWPMLRDPHVRPSNL